MKTTLLTVSMFIFAQAASAADVISCKHEQNGRLEVLRVYETSEGYEYEVKSCYTYHEVEQCNWNPSNYSESGDIEQNLYDGKPTRVYENESVRVVPFYEGYIFEHDAASRRVVFNPGECY